MSSLQRSFAKVQLQNLPPPDALDQVDEDGFDADEARPSIDSSSSASSTGTVTADDKTYFEKLPTRKPRSQYEPLPWQNFFESEIDIEGEQIRHHAYFTPPANLEAPLFCFHHGAGSSGLSFAMLTTALRATLPEAGFLSPDCRGHGQTVSDDSSLDLSLSTLAQDLAFVINQVSVRNSWSKLPPLVLIGHSLGGAVVTELAYTKLLGKALLGYGVLDVVEGSAMDALQSMVTYLSTRPKSFPSLSSGIEWHVRSRTIRNTNSARVSVPPLLKHSDESLTLLTWRTNLSATEPFWENWFAGLSSKFLNVPGAGKLLILAGTDRLDKELMIGQMQGKYQLQVFPEAGHFLHEDQPEKTAMIIADFYRRNDRSTLVLPPKVDDLVKQGKLKAPKQ